MLRITTGPDFFQHASLNETYLFIYPQAMEAVTSSDNKIIQNNPGVGIVTAFPFPLCINIYATPWAYSNLNDTTRKPVGFMQSCCHWWMTYDIRMSSAHHADNIHISSACDPHVMGTTSWVA